MRVRPRIAPILFALATACSDSGIPRGILLVTIDTCRADRIGCYGARGLETPAIDGVAADGILFEQAGAPAPMTLPSHASILTGLYPDRHGVRDNGLGRLPDEAITLAEALADAGWTTAGFIAAVPLESRYGTAQGFGTYDDVLGDSSVADPLVRLHTDQRTADVMVDRAAPWLREAASGRRPFLGWVHFFDPHAPYQPPPDLVARYGTPSYEGEIAFVDREIARLLEALGEARPRTIVAITADHGESLGEHGEATHGFLLYEPAVHVPWLMAGPGLPRGVRVKAPVSLVQVMPTLLDAVGVAAPPGLDGASALPLVRSVPADTTDLFAEALFPRLNFGWAGSRSIRRGAWKYIEAPRPELYDLAADPRESRDVSADHPDVASELRERLHDHFARGGTLNPAAATLGEETLEQLDRLGYVGAGRSPAPTENLWDFGRRDPKDVVGVFDALQPLPQIVLTASRDEARARVAELLARDPDNAAILRRVAQLWLRAGAWEDARDVCRRALAADPNDAEIRRGLGTALRRLGDEAGALTTFREACDRNPDDALAWAAIGALHAQAGRCAEADEALDRAARLGLPTARSAVEAASAWETCGRADRALAAYERALGLDTRFVPALNGKALVLSHTGRAADAVVLLREAVAATPDDVETLNNLAWILADAGIDPAEGLEHARRAAALAPEDPVVLDTLGWAAIRAGHAADGVAALEKAWRATSDAEVRAHLGVALAESGREAEGRTHVRAALRARPALAEIPAIARWR